MKKYLYIAAFAALALTACSDDENNVFDQSAAERLEQYKKDYAEVLTDKGGLWTMEYFSNPDEPGYVFVMKFDTNGSVTISANHKWIGSQFKQETSLWKMIADNGPVLSFNSYNNLFHIFADPANIEGPDAPTGDYGDINETGYGHEGDYEFQVMEVSDDKNTVRLLGKKRMYDIYLHRLDADTDPAQYLADVKAVASRFSSKFNDMTMIDADGNRYRVKDLYKGIPSIYPLGIKDYVDQTVSGNAILTLSGFRFMEPLEVKRSNNSTFTITELTFAEDGSLHGENVEDLRGVSTLECLIREDLTWTIDKESLTGKVKELYDAANAACVSTLTAKDKLGNIDFTYGADAFGNTTPQLVTRIGSKVCRNYLSYDIQYIKYTDLSEDADETAIENKEIVPSDELHFSFTGANSTATKYEGQIPAYKAFKDYLTSNFIMSVQDVVNSDVLVITDKNDPSSSFVVKTN